MGDRNRGWRVDTADLHGMTPARARDMLVDCFFAAQHEAYSLTSHGYLGEIGRAEVRKTVESLIQLKFRELGCCWEDPTPDDLQRVALTLAVEASAWGTPAETIERSMSELRKVQERLVG